MNPIERHVYARSFGEMMRLAQKGTHTMAWNRSGDSVFVTIGPVAYSTDQDGLEKLKRTMQDARAKRRRQRHDSLGILGTLKRALLKPKATLKA